MRALWVFAGFVWLAAGCAVPGGQAASGDAVEARPAGAQLVEPLCESLEFVAFCHVTDYHRRVSNNQFLHMGSLWC